MSAYTPMIQQYLAIKEGARDAILFFRLGDFYEMFFDDAIHASRELEITLTGREGGGEKKIPMCGVPYHAAEGYVARLIEKGFKVAICEQVEDPSAAKGVVRREIIRVVTPGTVMESKSLAEKANNFIVSVSELEGVYGVAACDLTTGELYVTSFAAAAESLADEINVYHPAEIVGDASVLGLLRETSAGWNRPVLFTDRVPMAEEMLRQQFGQLELAALAPARHRAVSLLTGYLDETQKRSLGHVRRISVYEPNQFMVLDPFTRRNLELTETVRDRSKKGTLLWLLDRTRTSMGARLLRRWIDKPLLSKTMIDERLEAVEKLYLSFILRDELRRELNEIYDLERLVGRVAYGSANGRDLNALKTSLQHVPALTALCAESDSSTLRKLVAGVDGCADLAAMIETVIVDEPPVSVRDGGLIRTGYDGHLDELREASVNGKKWLAELERREREATGIKSLKIGYNKVFGYYLEVSKANIGSLPEGRYERKQTLTNAERYVTPELKEKEALILEAEEKMVDLEYGIFIELRDHLTAHLHRLQKLAEVIAALDVYQSLATVSGEQRYVKPNVTESYDFVVAEGRHPVVEAVMEGSAFIANETKLEKADSSMLLITGPNMAGKSTYMRQVALISIMAQIGCFVPAKQAEVPLIDRIFTRIGAADDLIGGQSTFMVEMKDIQIMTEKATAQSLVIIDELGRGTSTGEGMAIAQAVIEFVHHEVGCKALVSTHFHELAHLGDSLPHLANACMAVQETGDNVTFLRKLVPGAAGSSYGIYCAQLAGLPSSIIGRAYSLLEVHARHEAAAAASELPFAPSSAGKDAQGAASASAAKHASEGIRFGTAYAAAEKSAVYAAPAAEAPAAGSPATGAGLTGEPASPSAAAATASEFVQLSIFEEPAPVAAASESGKLRKASPRAEQLAEQLRKLDLFNLTPMQAMQWINDMKLKLSEEK
ncbi:DNA mismatch repair protein MutS [Paenibacillus sacheonensis]|uniref:DNA mismatch repair protein MutS n=1 Tax=Paenibacillus sacheonensis TaxID=742054 RepID=A0A7X5BZB8_9BACL|nr:DNA mismatch repair protein MutS [Paenibacillus sacheonensis]MBM7563390.1 DNA mismatch repair protein MutS [Paenibacillus sacheonensis]NBC68055.1 DNA mismatch repair protein MutS [Paenibacillus sacheonensis]